MIRFFDTGYQNAAFNMALDEALLLKCERPTLRLYNWRPSAVSIGYFQGAEQEVDFAQCMRLGVNVVRRLTGGGAVFHENELTYSFVTRDLNDGIDESYKEICSAIITGLRSRGIKAGFSGINDIVVRGKKVSGNAQTRKNGALLQHGTLLLKTDIKRMFSVLKVPKEKLSDKGLKEAHERVTGLGITRNEAVEALKNGFEAVFGKLAEGAPSEEELDIAHNLERKYTSKEWTHKR